MYNADRRSKEFIDGVHYFLRVAKENKQGGFICCPCALCQNLKEYSSSRNIHSHLLKSGFMANYICVDAKADLQTQRANTRFKC